MNMPFIANAALSVLFLSLQFVSPWCSSALCSSPTETTYGSRQTPKFRHDLDCLNKLESHEHFNGQQLKGRHKLAQAVSVVDRAALNKLAEALLESFSDLWNPNPSHRILLLRAQCNYVIDSQIVSAIKVTRTSGNSELDSYFTACVKQMSASKNENCCSSRAILVDIGISGGSTTVQIKDERGNQSALFYKDRCHFVR